MSENQGMKYDCSANSLLILLKVKSVWSRKKSAGCSEHWEHSQEGVALVQLEDYINVLLAGKCKTDLRSPFRSDLNPLSSNGFHIDTS